jgi:methylated-DNA-[protein]-cysteine S-methyltransferase
MNHAWIGVLESTPLGPVWVAVSKRGLVAVEIGGDDGGRRTNDEGVAVEGGIVPEAIVRVVRRLGFSQVAVDQERTGEALRQIAEYLQGERQVFDLPIDWSVLTSFQEQALRATYAIPCGQTTTYGAIARGLGKPRAARAVGRAEATNPMPLVIPCHRVLGADGGLHGYGAGKGLETKKWLLELEKGH